MKTGQTAMPKGLICVAECSCGPVSQGLMLDLVLFNILVNDGAEFTLSVFTSDAKVKGEVARPDGCATIHRDID